MNRVVMPEWLDELAPADSAASASRRDLQRLNAWMGHAKLVAQTLRQLFPDAPPAHLAELGCGDGTLMLRVAQQIGWRNVHLFLVDLHPILSSTTARAYAALDWKVEPVAAEVLDWLPKQAGLDGLAANLFLHHLDDEKLSRLFSAASGAARAFVACEPRRSRLRELASDCLWVLGASAVTQHDAPVSVRAGFSDRELSNLWPNPGWAKHEVSAGLFSHLFFARKEGP